MQASLFKKNNKYTTNDGVEKTSTNFFLQCGDSLIPIDVKYFPDRETKKDVKYNGRRDVLRAFASELPEIKG